MATRLLLCFIAASNAAAPLRLSSILAGPLSQQHDRLSSIFAGPTGRTLQSVGLPNLGGCNATNPAQMASNTCCPFNAALVAAVNSSASTCPHSSYVLNILTSQHALLMPNDTARMAALDQLCGSQCWASAVQPLLDQYAALPVRSPGCVEFTFTSAQLQMACLRDATTGQFCHQTLAPVDALTTGASLDVNVGEMGMGGSSVTQQQLSTICSSSCIAAASALYASTGAIYTAGGIPRTVNFTTPLLLDMLATSLAELAHSIPRLLSGVCMRAGSSPSSPFCDASPLSDFNTPPNPSCVSSTCDRVRLTAILDRGRFVIPRASMLLYMFIELMKQTMGPGGSGGSAFDPWPADPGAPNPYDPETGNWGDWTTNDVWTQDDFSNGDGSYTWTDDGAYAPPQPSQLPRGHRRQLQQGSGGGGGMPDFSFIFALLADYQQALEGMALGHGSVASPADGALSQMSSLSCGLQASGSTCADEMEVLYRALEAGASDDDTLSGAPFSRADLAAFTLLSNPAECPVAQPASVVTTCSPACASSVRRMLTGSLGCCTWYLEANTGLTLLQGSGQVPSDLGSVLRNLNNVSVACGAGLAGLCTAPPPSTPQYIGLAFPGIAYAGVEGNANMTSAFSTALGVDLAYTAFVDVSSLAINNIQPAPSGTGCVVTVQVLAASNAVTASVLAMLGAAATTGQVLLPNTGLLVKQNPVLVAGAPPGTASAYFAQPIGAAQANPIAGGSSSESQAVADGSGGMSDDAITLVAAALALGLVVALGALVYRRVWSGKGHAELTELSHADTQPAPGRTSLRASPAPSSRVNALPRSVPPAPDDVRSVDLEAEARDGIVR